MKNPQWTTTKTIKVTFFISFLKVPLSISSKYLSLYIFSIYFFFFLLKNCWFFFYYLKDQVPSYKLIIPEPELPKYIADPSQFSPIHINKSDLGRNEQPEPIQFPLGEFELHVIKHNYTILRYGRKYYNIGNSVIFEERFSSNEKRYETTFRGWMFSLTSPNCYSLRIVMSENFVKSYYCSCEQSKNNKILMCHHLVAGFFHLRYLFKVNHHFSGYDEELERESEENDNKKEVFKEIDNNNRKPSKTQTKKNGTANKQQNSQLSEVNIQEVRKKFSSTGEEENVVLKELLCQICMEILNKPVSMPCLAHSICEECIRKYLMVPKNFNQENGIYRFNCPTCGGENMKIDFLRQEFKINKEIERVRDAHIRYLDEKCLNREKCQDFEVKKAKTKTKRKFEEFERNKDEKSVKSEDGRQLRKAHSMMLRDHKQKFDRKNSKSAEKNIPKILEEV